MDRPDESPPRSLREARRGSIPFSMQLDTHPLQAQVQPQSQQQPLVPSTTTNLPPFNRRRSSPLSSGVHSQHVSQPLSSEHSQQYHSSHMDDPQDYLRSNPSSQRRATTPPPVTHPRSIQRVPPPALVESDNRYNANLRDEWSMADQYLEMDQNQNSFSTAEPNLGSGIIGNPSGQALNNAAPSMPKGPIIEREREGKSREQKELSRDIDNIPSGGSAASGPRRSDSLRRNTRPPQPQTQSIQTKNVTPPPSHNQPNQPPGQTQRPALYSDRSTQSLSRSSPTYVSPGGNNNSQVDPQLYATQSQQPTSTHHRDNSPPMRYEERTQPAKAKTPDRSLPVQEENEAEEDVPIMAPPIDRERTRERQRDLDNETIKPRTLSHRLPTPQFSKSPMIPGGDRMQPITTAGGAASSEELSTTVQDDEYDAHQDHFDDDRNGRSSRASHRYEEEEEDHHDHGKVSSEHIDQNNLVQPDIEEQEDTETYTPRSPPANLPQSIPHLHNANNHNNPNNNVHAERVMYHNNPSLSHLHFRPRTASSDAGGMPNLDAAVLQPLASEHNRTRGVTLDGTYSQSHSYGPHTTLPQRVPTIDEIRALADGALHRQTVRPGAPIPPTPPNNGTYPILSYLQPSVSPPPPRATPYPYSYPYQHIMQQSPDPNQMLQQLLGMQTDSTFSPSSTPYPTYDYNPFLPEHFRRHDPTMSMRSSPSHMPVNLPFFPVQPNRFTQRKKKLKRTQSHRDLARTLPPRGESTEPRETTPEPLDSEDEDIDDEYHDMLTPQEGMSSDNTVSTARGGATRKEDNGNVVHNEDDEGDWIDEDDDDDESDLDLVHYESLPFYHPNPDKRRRRWEAQWNLLVNAFQNFDRQTNSSMILMAAPANSSKRFYSIRSRSLRRDPSLFKSAEMRKLRGTFKNLVTQQKGHSSSRNQPSHMSLVERFEHYSASSSDTIENREEELKNTLGAALSTINALTNIYEGRDQRWGNEMNLRRDERERVDILLRQAFGFGLGGI